LNQVGAEVAAGGEREGRERAWLLTARKDDLTAPERSHIVAPVSWPEPADPPARVINQKQPEFVA
jgi:hypothetical protein